MAKDKVEVHIGDNNEVYLHCTNCHYTYQWTPYMPKRLKGKIGKFTIPHIDYQTYLSCKHCAPLMQLWLGIEDVKECIEEMGDD